jgi:hypothetical protein
MVPMNHPSRKKIITSWIIEIFFLILQIITSILYIPLLKNTKGNRGNILIITDLLTSPLLYLYFRQKLAREGYNIFFYYCFNPFLPLKRHTERLSELLLKIPNNQFTIIAHGAGGLLPLSLPDEARKKIHRLITLDTPFWGTQLFQSLKFIKAFYDISPRSEYLLAYKMNALLYEEFFPIVAWQDEWIVPENLLRFGQGRDILLDIPGRLNLILHRENVNTIIQFCNQFFPHNIILQNKPKDSAREKKSKKKSINQNKK